MAVFAFMHLLRHSDVYLRHRIIVSASNKFQFFHG